MFGLVFHYPVQSCENCSKVTHAIEQPKGRHLSIQ